MMGRELEGLVKVELYNNKTMKKEAEIKTHNFISKLTREFYYRLQFNALFTKWANTETANIDFSTEVGNPFGFLILTTATHDESPSTERDLKGSLVGYASTDEPYSGALETRGTLNQNETSIGVDKARFVFDFPTDRANGTFQSIYFTHKKLPLGEDVINNLPNIPNKDKLIGDIKGIQRLGNRLYVVSRNNVIVYDSSMNPIVNLGLRDFGYDGDEFTNEYATLIGPAITEQGDKMYILKPTSINSGTYWRLDSVNLTTFEVINEITSVTSSNYGDVFAVKDGFLWVSDRYGNTNSLTVRRLNIGENTLNSIPVDFTEVDGVTGLFGTGGSTDYLYTKNITWVEDDIAELTIELRQTKRSLSVLARLEGNTFKVLPVVTSPKWGRWNDDYKITPGLTLAPEGQISSRVKLRDPVTKTEQHTMKVTYEFTLPKLPTV